MTSQIIIDIATVAVLGVSLFGWLYLIGSARRERDKISRACTIDDSLGPPVFGDQRPRLAVPNIEQRSLP
jgi:hypothetical protein